MRRMGWEQRLLKLLCKISPLDAKYEFLSMVSAGHVAKRAGVIRLTPAAPKKSKLDSSVFFTLSNHMLIALYVPDPLARTFGRCV